MTRTFCPCKRCRPPTLSFSDAMKVSVRLGEVRRWGVEGANRREQEKWDRLRGLRERGQEEDGEGGADD